MSINDRFSKDGNSPILLDQYKDFSSSKLSEMLTMSDEQIDQVTITTTRAEIREMKQPVKEEVVAPAQQEPECFIRDQINDTGEDDLKCSGGISEECQNCDKTERKEIVLTSEQKPEPKKPYYECAAYRQLQYKDGCKNCYYDKADCPYDRTGYFEKIKQQEEWNIHCEVLKEMCDSLCKIYSFVLEKNDYCMETIKSLSRDKQEFSFGFGDDGAGHSKYMASCKKERYRVEEFDGAEKWIFEAGEVDQQIWNYNGNTWRFEQHEAKKLSKSIDELDFTVRTYNCLKRANIDTIDQLCKLTEDEVIAIRNISRKCLDEIKEKLSEIGRELKPDMDDIPVTVNDSSEIVDDDTEIVNDADETEPERMDCDNCNKHHVLGDTEYCEINSKDIGCTKYDPIETDLPCDTCGHNEMGCCGYDTKDEYCVQGDKWVAKEPEPVEIVEADIIQTVPEEPFTDQCEASGLKFNNWLKANGSSIADIVSIVLYDKEIPDKDNLHEQIQNGLISKLISKTEAYYKYLTSELGIEPERPKQIQPNLPILKNNDQRKEWAENYKAWGEWYCDEHIDCHYYKYDFANGDRLIVDEYRDREYYWASDRKDEQHYHLLQKKKQAYGETKTFEQKYVHQTSSMTEIVEYLKDLQKKGA